MPYNIVCREERSLRNAMTLKLLKTGTIFLKIFFISILADIVLLAVFLSSKSRNPAVWIPVCIGLAVLEFLVFWAGIILTYVSSTQLGVKTRVWGVILGWVPVAHLVMLRKIIKTCSDEIRFETFVKKRNEARKAQHVCQTKYPILMVHGVFFRDSEHLNYWGRIPRTLEENGATIYYGGQNSAAAVRNSGKELEKRVRQILDETGAEKVNIIAHSKGGLDARAMIAENPQLAASLTTINTPHRGCEFADYFFNKMPDAQKNALASKYNTMAAKLGDVDPDFLSAVRDLTSSACEAFNRETPDVPGVWYQSFGSVLRKASSGQFPLNLTHLLVKYFDGENDGLVGAASFPWGEKTTLLKNETSPRGISHGDVIDLNRENIDGFDVRELYVQIVQDLKERGF